MTEPSSRAPAEHVLRGRSVRVVRGGFLGVLRVISGWAFVRALLAALSVIVALRTEVEVSLEQDRVRIRRVRRVLSRVVSESEHVIAQGLVGVARERRFPARYSLIGAAVFAAGLLAAGGLWLAGAGAGGGSLLLVAGGALAGSIAVDFVLDALLARGAPCVTVELNVAGKSVLRIAGVPAADADKLLREFTPRA